MEEKYILITSPTNEKLIKTMPQSFLQSLSDAFGEEFSLENTILYTNLIFDEDRVHIFQNSEYKGYLKVHTENGNTKISAHH